MMGLSDGERILMLRSAVLIQSMRVTDRRNFRGIRAIAYMLSRVKTWTWTGSLQSFLSLINIILDGKNRFTGHIHYLVIRTFWLSSVQRFT